MIDNAARSECGEAARTTSQLLDIAVHARPVCSKYAITFIRVVLDPVLPTERGHPKAGNENNRGDVHCQNAPRRRSCSPGNSSMIGGRKLNTARLLMSRGSCL